MWLHSAHLELEYPKRPYSHIWGFGAGSLLGGLSSLCELSPCGSVVWLSSLAGFQQSQRSCQLFYRLGPKQA